MALPFNTFSNEAVPSGTIRPTYDAYFQGTVNTSPTNTKKGIFGGQPVRVLNQSVGPKVMFSKTPIGGWSITEDGEKSTRFFHSAPEKLTDEIATNCAGGSRLDYDQLLRYNDGGVDTSCSVLTEDRLGHGSQVPTKFFQQSRSAKTQGGVHYPTLCQMGDYVSTVLECANQCEGISPNPEGVGDNYCHFAKNRLCGKLKGDPIKKNSTGGVVSSDKDWITDETCVDYCGGPKPDAEDAEDTDPTCLEKKNKYCGKSEDWYSTKFVNEKLNMTKADYCKTFWTRDFNNDAADKACSSNLTENFDKEKNLLSKTNIGCIKLCPLDGKNQVNQDFCERMKDKFCNDHLSYNTPPAEDSGLYYDFCKGVKEEKKLTEETLVIIISCAAVVVILFILFMTYTSDTISRRIKKASMLPILPIFMNDGRNNGGRNNGGYDKFITFLNDLLYKLPCNLNS